MAEMDTSNSMVTIAHPGIMIGAADPIMGFPAGTRFKPYLAFRNLTGSAEQVNLTLYTAQGTAITASVQAVQPFESRNVDLSSILQQIGLKDFNGELTLAVSHSGGVSDLISVAGSVDATGTYVFEVDGRAVEQRLSKESPYWSVKNGNDTMVAFWNPSGSAQDVMVTLRYFGGSGVYHFRVHLGPHATGNLDLKELIANQSPDEDGNTLPINLQEGSFVFHNARDVHAPLALNVNVGIYNVTKGTCYYGTVQCAGYYGNLIVSPSSSSLSADGGQVMVQAYGQYSDGSQPVVNASFSSSNSSVASVSGQTVTASNTAGNATITASASLPEEGSYSGYNPSCSSLQPYITYTGTATVSVGDNSPVVTGISPSDWNSGTTTPVTISGQYFGTNAPTLSFSPGSGISYALTGYSDTQITANVSVAASTPNETVAVTVTANGYNGSGFQSNGNGQGAQSSSVTAAVHAKMNYTDITVVGWVNASAITLPTGENASLQYDLNYAARCAYDVIMWSQGKRPDLNNTTTDPAYASAYLLQHSGNTAPPSTITPSSFGQNKNNYRLFNDFGSPAGGTIQIGNTPNPCGTGVIANWTSAAGESSPYAGTGTSSSGQAYQLAEGRLGKTGQNVNQTLNGVSTPFIWSTIEFTPAGVPTYSDVAMFPTYYVYKNGALVATYPQSSATAFNAQTASYQRLPSQIP